MKRLFKVAFIAILALAAVSCTPSVVGEWEYLYTEDYPDGEFEEKTTEEEGWGFVFNEDGTGFEVDDDLMTPIFWEIEGGQLYYDYKPLTVYDEEDAMEIESADSDHLKLRWYYVEDSYEKYTFRRVK